MNTSKTIEIKNLGHVTFSFNGMQIYVDKKHKTYPIAFCSGSDTLEYFDSEKGEWFDLGREARDLCVAFFDKIEKVSRLKRELKTLTDKSAIQLMKQRIALAEKKGE